MTSSLFSWPVSTPYTTSVLIQYLLPASSARKEGCCAIAGRAKMIISKTRENLSLICISVSAVRGSGFESSPQFREPSGIGYPLHGFRIVPEVFVDGHG